MTWQDDAACAGTDTETFYPTQGGESEMTRYAKRLCSACPVQAECLEFALTMQDVDDFDHGIWGGTTPTERRRIRRQRGKLCIECRLPMPGAHPRQQVHDSCAHTRRKRMWTEYDQRRRIA